MTAAMPNIVMPGLDPGRYVLAAECGGSLVDGRVEARHDDRLSAGLT
jgi:hypothetical protein